MSGENENPLLNLRSAYSFIKSKATSLIRFFAFCLAEAHAGDPSLFSFGCPPSLLLNLLILCSECMLTYRISPPL